MYKYSNKRNIQIYRQKKYTNIQTKEIHTIQTKEIHIKQTHTVFYSKIAVNMIIIFIHFGSIS